jgi:hypothetical protein
VRGKYNSTLVAPLEELVNAAAHRFLDNMDDLLKVNTLVIISFDTEEPSSPLVVGGHGHLGEKLIDLILTDREAFQYPHGALLHDVLGAGAGGHARDFGTDAFPDDRAAECPPRDSTCMHLYDLLTGSFTDRRLALHHVLAAHVHLCPVRVFVTIEQFSCHNAAELFNLVDIAVNRLLQYFVDHLKIPGKVCSLEAAGQVNVYVEIGNKNDRPFLMAMYFDKFFYIFNPDTGEVYPDVR